MDESKEEKLSILGAPIKKFPNSPEEAELETFQNSYSGRDYWITLECPEYTSLCPKTNQPDFGKIIIKYVPDEKCIETKSLKVYLFSFRNIGIFVEDSVNQILNKIIESADPKKAKVIGEFNPRGGITISVEANYEK